MATDDFMDETEDLHLQSSSPARLRKTNPPELTTDFRIPLSGFICGFQYLLMGICPYCETAIQNIALNDNKMTWMCTGGCKHDGL